MLRRIFYSPAIQTKQEIKEIHRNRRGLVSVLGVLTASGLLAGAFVAGPVVGVALAATSAVTLLVAAGIFLFGPQKRPIRSLSPEHFRFTEGSLYLPTLKAPYETSTPEQRIAELQRIAEDHIAALRSSEHSDTDIQLIRDNLARDIAQIVPLPAVRPSSRASTTSFQK